MRTVLVGAGKWGENVARTLRDLKAEGLVELSYVVDVNLSRALELSRTYGFRAAAGSIGEASGEAFVIATSIDALYSSALEAIDRAACVFVEKPVATSPAEAAELLVRAEARGVVHQAGYLSRFDPTVVELGRLLLGRRVYAMRFRRLSRRPPHMRSYPVTLDLMPHDIDLAFFLLGRREARITFSLLAVDGGVPQRAVAGATYDGVDVVFEADGMLPVKIREVDVLAEDGMIRADLVSRVIEVVAGSHGSQVSASGEEPLKAELRAFVERCRGAETAAPDLRDAVEVLKVVEELSRRAVVLREHGELRAS